jgi:hypothetical protein
MSMFDPAVFLDAQVDEVNEKRPPLPTENPESSDGLYTAQIGEIKPTSGVIGKGERAGQPWAGMIIPLKVQVPASLQAIGIPKEVTITDRAFLDLTPQGTLDNGPGKNRAQRIYREATGNNQPGKPFAWRMLEGQFVTVKIAHEIYNDTTQERVGSVQKAG